MGKNTKESPTSEEQVSGEGYLLLNVGKVILLIVVLAAFWYFFDKWLAGK